ncbi:RecX family transcriptional regulator [Roseivirga seohaensis]|uniref:Regulatory protein RecX n=1 Tax=Roseivirga seohaensis TaxID=1914963 RepID=A0A150Y0F9_9BACT|nr:RecX family transcriptional regulator [Roseivirga seohaensis]KYG84530.1 RecX family transcriptional regulator [Roseivirga seohaensis]
MAFQYEERKPKRLDPKVAKLKAADFCAYQERSQQEVRDKLYSYGLHHDEVEEILSDLITDNFINEERFAKAYVGGKFRIKGWGKRKILQGLKQHRISDYCIKKGFQEIDPDDYYATLMRHAEKKLPTIKAENQYTVRGKLTQHLVMKGFEGDLIREVIEELLNSTAP